MSDKYTELSDSLKLNEESHKIFTSIIEAIMNNHDANTVKVEDIISALNAAITVTEKLASQTSDDFSQWDH